MSITIITVLPNTITNNSVTSGAYSISDPYPLTITSKGLCIGTSPHPTTQTSSGSGGTFYFSQTIGSLSSGTTYYIRSYVYDSGGTVTYGNEYSFNTLTNALEINNCTTTNVSVPAGMTYVLPQGAEIISTPTTTDLTTLESSCIDPLMIKKV